jgi:hypothetical protein
MGVNAQVSERETKFLFLLRSYITALRKLKEFTFLMRD